VQPPSANRGILGQGAPLGHLSASFASLGCTHAPAPFIDGIHGRTRSKPVPREQIFGDELLIGQDPDGKTEGTSNLQEMASARVLAPIASLTLPDFTPHSLFLMLLNIIIPPPWIAEYRSRSKKKIWSMNFKGGSENRFIRRGRWLLEDGGKYPQDQGVFTSAHFRPSIL
jgi:hypothetical protein